MSLVCGDVFGAFQSLLTNDINPLVTGPAILVSPILGLAAMLLSVMLALMACFAN